MEHPILEWLRGFSIWPLPLLTISTVALELGFYLHFLMSPNEYTNNLLDSNLLFRQDKKTEIWRWFTYSFCHADAVHLLSNLISQLFLGLFLEIEHKVIN